MIFLTAETQSLFFKPPSSPRTPRRINKKLGELGVLGGLNFSCFSLRSLRLCGLILFLAVPAFAQDDPGYQQRLELAKQMQEINPARGQVDNAIDRAAQSMPAAEQESFRTAMRSALNYKAVEKVSIEAMAKVYTEEELKAMIAYYSTPEAKSAGAKQKDYAALVTPEIIRMLDEAAMRVKTGKTAP